MAEMSSSVRLVIALLVFAVVFLLAVRFIPGTAGYQLANMRKVDQYLPGAEKVLRQDDRFRAVHIGRTTAEDGAVRVYGVVQSQTDHVDLKRLIAASHPPRPVVDLVRVEPAMSPATSPTTSAGSAVQ